MLYMLNTRPENQGSLADCIHQKKKKGYFVAIFNMYVSNLQNGMLVPTAR